MEAALTEALTITTVISSKEDILEYIQNIRKHTDIILTYANISKNIHSINTKESRTTELLLLINKVFHTSHIVGIAILLQLQSDLITELTINSFLITCNTFINSCIKEYNEYIYKEINIIAHQITKIACKINKPCSVITILYKVINLIMIRPNCLTAIHSDLLQVCIKGQMYNYAIDFLKSNEILEIDMSYCNITSSDYLRYFYYSGICYISIKDYYMALESFYQCIVAPAEKLSAIVVCAIKKAKLLSLIEHGTELNITSSVSSIVTRFLKQDLHVYDDITKAFLKNNDQNILDIINQNIDILNKDLNLGIAKQTYEALYKHRIQRLSKTFITLSPDDIMNKVNITNKDKLLQILLQLSYENKISIKINDLTNMLNFTEDINMNDNQMIMCQLDNSLQQTILLSSKLRDLKKDILTSSKYILKSTSSTIVYTSSDLPSDYVTMEH